MMYFFFEGLLFLFLEFEDVLEMLVLLLVFFVLFLLLFICKFLVVELIVFELFDLGFVCMDGVGMEEEVMGVFEFCNFFLIKFKVDGEFCSLEGLSVVVLRLLVLMVGVFSVIILDFLLDNMLVFEIDIKWLFVVLLFCFFFNLVILFGIC